MSETAAPAVAAAAEANAASQNQAAAVASQAAPAQAAAEPTAAEADAVVTAFGARTGDAGLDMALGFLAQNGYTNESPAVQAAREGDFSLIRAEMAARGIQGASEYLALAEQGYGRLIEADRARDADIRDTILQEVGGEAAWNEIAGWAKANIQEAFHSDINAALATGGIVASAMAQFLRSQMLGAGEVAPRSPVAGNAEAAVQSNTTLTFKEYQQEVRRLNELHHGNIDNLPEYADLKRRLRM